MVDASQPFHETKQSSANRRGRSSLFPTHFNVNSINILDATVVSGDALEHMARSTGIRFQYFQWFPPFVGDFKYNFTPFSISHTHPPEIPTFAPPTRVKHVTGVGRLHRNFYVGLKLRCWSTEAPPIHHIVVGCDILGLILCPWPSIASGKPNIPSTVIPVLP